jgi:hypothetical protein
MENRSFCIVSLRLACLEEKQTFWRELARLAAPAFPPASRTDGDIIDRSDQFSCFDVSFVFQILLAFSVGLSLGWLAGRFQGVRVKCSRVSWVFFADSRLPLSLCFRGGGKVFLVAAGGE